MYMSTTCMYMSRYFTPEFSDYLNDMTLTDWIPSQSYYSKVIDRLVQGDPICMCIHACTCTCTWMSNSRLAAIFSTPSCIYM